jgi:predicted phosphodiesterase
MAVSWKPENEAAFRADFAEHSTPQLAVIYQAPSVRTLERYIVSQQALGILPYKDKKKRVKVTATAHAVEGVKVDEERMSYGDSGARLDVYLPKTTIKSLEDLLAYCNVDPDVWYADTFDLAKWDQGAKIKVKVGEDDKGNPIYDEEMVTQPLFKVHARLKRRPQVEGVKEVIKKLFEEAGTRAPKYKKVVRPTHENGQLLELNPIDHHFAKLAWAQEAGEDYDTQIAYDLFVAAMTDLAQRAARSNSIDQILLIIGNDLMQIDNPSNTTTAGTPVDVDSRFTRVFELVCHMLVYVIDEVLLPIANVRILAVPGNHDKYTTFHLGSFLKAWYRNNDQVYVDNGPTQRKYYKYGKNLLMFTHGDKIKRTDLPQIMASEQKHLWAETDYRFIKTGHLHKKALFTRIDIDEHYGVQVSICPTLCAADAWHAENGFIANMRRSEAYIYDKELGPMGALTFTVPR